MDKGLEDRHMTWKSCDKSLEWSRRIRKSLEMELELEDDVKGHGFLMMCTCIAEIKDMMSGHM